MIEQSEDDGNIILECIADANPNDVTVSFSFYTTLKPNKSVNGTNVQNFTVFYSFRSFVGHMAITLLERRMFLWMECEAT